MTTNQARCHGHETRLYSRLSFTGGYSPWILGGAKNGDNNLTWIYAISGVALSTGNKKTAVNHAAADIMIV